MTNGVWNRWLTSLVAGVSLCLAAGCSREGASATATLDAVVPMPPLKNKEIATSEKTEINEHNYPAKQSGSEKQSVAGLDVTATPETIKLAAVAGAELVRAALSPPQQTEFPAVPYRAQPEPWRGMRFDPPPASVMTPPAAVVRQQSQLLEQDQQITLRVPAARDIPPVGLAINLPRPERPEFAVAPLAYSRSIDPTRFAAFVTKLAPTVSPNDTNDVTLSASRAMTLTLLPALRTLPAPFLPLTIPDPFEHIRALRLRQPIPDADAPATHQTRPERPLNNR